MVSLAAKLIVFSGAGLSADSGIPTFRDADGLWENHDVDVVANGHTWKRNFDIVRKFYNDRRTALSGVAANPMHQMIGSWERRFNTVILTQNIDDLLERAGCQSVVHLHGKLTELRCEACGTVWDIGYSAWDEAGRCGKCDSVKGVRPNVVFFNENAPEYRRMYRAFRDLQAKDCVVVVGTSGQVISLDSFLFDCPALKVLNNLGPSKHLNESHFDHVLYGKASEKVREIDQLVTAHMEAK